MQIDYQKFTGMTAETIRFYLATAKDAKAADNEFSYQISMGSAAAVYYHWEDVAKTLSVEKTLPDALELMALIQAVEPTWPPTEESVAALKAEIDAMSK